VAKITPDAVYQHYDGGAKVPRRSRQVKNGIFGAALRLKSLQQTLKSGLIQFAFLIYRIFKSKSCYRSKVVG
jgi:hypothetical protein